MSMMIWNTLLTRACRRRVLSSCTILQHL